MKLDQRQRKLLLCILGAVALIVILLLLPMMAPKDRRPDATLVGVIPEADLAEEEDSKIGSYRRSGGIGAYWDSLAESEGAGHDDTPEPATESPSDRRKPQKVDVEDLFGDSRGEPAPSAPPRRGGASKKPSAESSPPAPQATEPPQQTPGPESEQPPQEKPRAQVKRSGAVSSLDEDVASDLGNGFSTLDGTDRWVGAEVGKPYRCMFTRDEKVKSGQRITVRLLEDLVIGGTHVPQNTHLQGVVQVSDRMEVRISSLDMGGRILTLNFEAYDTDGGKGIYCSDLSQTGKAVAEQGLSTLSSTLNSRLGRVARDAATVGASIVRNKAGEATVSVPAGYTFYIIEKTQ